MRNPKDNETDWLMRQNGEIHSQLFDFWLFGYRLFNSGEKNDDFQTENYLHNYG